MTAPKPLNSAGLPYHPGDVWTCPCGATGEDRDDRPDFHGRGPMGCTERRVFSVLSEVPHDAV